MEPIVMSEPGSKPAEGFKNPDTLTMNDMGEAWVRYDGWTSTDLISEILARNEFIESLTAERDAALAEVGRLEKALKEIEDYTAPDKITVYASAKDAAMFQRNMVWIHLRAALRETGERS